MFFPYIVPTIMAISLLMMSCGAMQRPADHASNDSIPLQAASGHWIKTPYPQQPPPSQWDSGRLFEALVEADFELFVTALPDYPVVISPDGYIDSSDLQLTPAQWKDTHAYLFGFAHGSGDSMNYVPDTFFIRFLAKPWHQGIRTYDLIPSECLGNTINNIREIWGDSVHFVNYCLPGTEQYGRMDWLALRIVWQDDSLLAIIRDAWSP